MADQVPRYLALRGHRRRQVAAEVADQFVRDRASVHELASKLGRRPSVVRRLLHEAGVCEADVALIGADEQETARGLARRYERSGSISALVRETGMDKRVIRSLLIEAGVSLPVRHFLSPEKVDQAVTRYPAGESIRTLAASIGCSYGTVRSLLQAAQVPLRPRGGSRAPGAGTPPMSPGEADRALGRA